MTNSSLAPTETATPTEPHANHSAVGATVTRVYYAVPDLYSIGECFDNYTKAVEFAREKLATHSTASVDTRMVLAYPTGGSRDFVFERHNITV